MNDLRARVDELGKKVRGIDELEQRVASSRWSSGARTVPDAERRLTPAHEALAKLEAAGYVEAVVTQNIDRLHELAGSRAVIEVHGSIRTSSCLACGRQASLDEVLRMLEDAPAPTCGTAARSSSPTSSCSASSSPRRRSMLAAGWLAPAGLLLVVGSSLAILPGD